MILTEKHISKVIRESLKYCLSEEIGEQYFYHATPSCYVASIKKLGLGAKIPKKRFWDYTNTPYENIKQGVFLATDEYVAESYLECSEEFEELADWYEERYDKELSIVVFQIKLSDLNPSLLSIDSNQSYEDEDDATYFYNGVIPFNKLKIVEL